MQRLSLKDRARLTRAPEGFDQLAKDKKVDFEFKQQGKDYVITSVK